MIGVFLEPGFFAREFLEMALGVGCTALLQALPKRMMRLAVAMNKLSTERLALGIGCQVDDTEINAKCSIRGSRGRFWNLKRYSQVELPVAVEQVSLPFHTLHACLLIATNQKWNKYPTRERHKGNGIKALKGHDTLIVDNRAFRPEMRLDALITLMGFTGLTNRAYCQLCRQ